VNVLNQIKQVPEVCRIYCATANPVEVILAETEQGRAILGVVDRGSPLGVETEEDVAARQQLLRAIGYKLQQGRGARLAQRRRMSRASSGGLRARRGAFGSSGCCSVSMAGVVLSRLRG
jgi:hypothetical protein